MKKSNTFLPIILVGTFALQGCYTQLSVEKKVVVVHERKAPDSVIVEETEDYSLVHEYHYWFNDYQYFQMDPWSPRPYRSYGYYIDISWYDPFYSPWTYGYHPYYNPWVRPYHHGYGYWAGWHPWHHHHHHGGWWSWHGGSGSYEPSPPKKPRDWDRRYAQNIVEPGDRGSNSSSGDIRFTGTRSNTGSNGNERPSITRTTNTRDKKSRVTKIEKRRDSTAETITKIVRAVSSSSSSSKGSVRKERSSSSSREGTRSSSVSRSERKKSNSDSSSKSNRSSKRSKRR